MKCIMAICSPAVPGAAEVVKVQSDNLVLRQPFIFTKDNIDQFEF